MTLAAIVVCGSRSVDRSSGAELLCARLRRQLDQWKAARERAGCTCLVIHGDCKRSPDEWADVWAVDRGVQVMRLPAMWKHHGHRAGPIRNAAQAQVLATLRDGGAVIDAIAVWDGSPTGGTQDAIEQQRARGIDPWWLRPDGGFVRL